MRLALAHRVRSQDWADSAAPTSSGMPSPCPHPALKPPPPRWDAQPTHPAGLPPLLAQSHCGFPPPPRAFLPGQPAGSTSVRVHAGSRPLRGSRPSPRCMKVTKNGWICTWLPLAADSGPCGRRACLTSACVRCQPKCWASCPSPPPPPGAAWRLSVNERHFLLLSWHKSVLELGVWVCKINVDYGLGIGRQPCRGLTHTGSGGGEEGEGSGPRPPSSVRIPQHLLCPLLFCSPYHPLPPARQTLYRPSASLGVGAP